MPAGNGTGPMGDGPMTGRRAGFCAGFSVPGYMNPMPGGGFGMGRGWGQGWGRGRGQGRGQGQGRGWRHGSYAMGIPGELPQYGAPPYYAPPSGEHEAQVLRTQAEHLEGTLDEIRKRISELEAAQKKDA